ncbi:MAG: SpoIIE family protein phosphatase, partial [Pseudanabaenaceae cyanobacterium]
LLLIFREGGVSDAYDSDELGVTVGLIEDISPFVGTKEVPLQVGDMVALYTDGFTEAENAQRQMYGLLRLQQVLTANAHRPVAEIQRAVLQDVRSFIGAHTVYDDLTLVLLRRQR